MTPSSHDASREFLRHTLATVAYRGAKALRGAPAIFADFSGAGRTPAQILTHMGDLFDWAFAMASGNPVWHDSKALPWDQEVIRFFAALKKFDDYLASDNELHAPVDKLFQGPIADALTHVGQLAMLRRLANCTMKGENYFAADIAIGRVSEQQSAPRKEF